MSIPFYQEEKFVEELQDLCRKACKNTLIYHRKSFNVENKSDNSPVTTADLTTNQIIVEGLEKYNIPILSEESRSIPYQERKDWEYIWVVDPLDGTKEFVKGGNDFTVNIGLLRNNKPVFGVVGVPTEGIVYTGIEGKGAFKCDGDGCQRITVAKHTPDRVRIVTSKSHFSPETQKFIDKFQDPELVNVGSSIKLLLIAEGSADIYPRVGLTSEWDTCAAHAIVKAAGANVLDLNTRTELQYNKEDILNPYFICTYEKFFNI